VRCFPLSGSGKRARLKSLLRRSTIVVSKKYVDGYQRHYEVSRLPDSEMIQIAEVFFEGDITVPQGQQNIRTFLTDLDFSHDRDIFPTPKDFVTDLLCPSKLDPWSHVGHVVMEHGCVSRRVRKHSTKGHMLCFHAGTHSAWSTKTTSTAPERTPWSCVSGCHWLTRRMTTQSRRSSFHF